jgi:hypothetical protein
VGPTLRLNRPQSDAFYALQPKRTLCLPWGRGVGKSWFLRAACWLMTAQHDGKVREGSLKYLRGVRIIWLMPSLKQFKAVHGADLDSEITGDWACLRGRLNRTDYRIEFPGGSWLQPFPAELHRSQSARGLRGDVVVIDETDDVDRSTYDAVVRPWFSEPWSFKMVLGGGTPRRGRKGLLYHLHSLGLDPVEPRYWTRHATWRDSPETVDPEEAADAQRNSPPSIYKREWECDFDAAEGLVYGEVFDERFHVREPPPNVRWTEILVGGDAGWEDPGVLLLIGVVGHGADAVAWVLDEVYEKHRTPTEWVQALKDLTALYPGAKLYHDPSSPDMVNEYRKYCIISPQKVDNSIAAGIRTVVDRFMIRGVGDSRAAHLYISPRCRNLIWELGAYKRKRDQHEPDRYLEEPEDKHNHACDALRYAIHNRFQSFSGTLNRNSYQSQGLGVPGT